MSKSKSKQSDPQKSHRAFSVAMILFAVFAVVVGVQVFGRNDGSDLPLPNTLMTSATPIGEMQLIPADQARALVGVVSGHRGYDPGAICSDGFSEVDANFVIAQLVVELLTQRGVRVDLLDEFDDRLGNYQANALVSIHADSCNIPGATGFKTARVTNSAIPEAEDHLVACLNREYANHTGLPEHPGSITDGMTNYHAFNQIHPQTPGAIIEVGFLLDDRDIIENHPDVVARGIAAGIMCFLEE